MSISPAQNFYSSALALPCAAGAVNIYLDTVPTVDSGFLVISPANASKREIVKFTAKGTDGNGDYVTVILANRGLGGTSDIAHLIDEPVYMNVVAEHLTEISDAIDQIVAGGAQDAAAGTKGITRLSTAPAVATQPIAVGDNDDRVPTPDRRDALAKGGDYGDADTDNPYITKQAGHSENVFIPPVVRVYDTAGGETDRGDSTSQFDISDEGGDTFRYTWDGNGTDPAISAANYPTGASVIINSTGFVDANEGLFVITASGTNYFEVTNADGVAEVNKTLGSTAKFAVINPIKAWTKPANLKYVVVEVQGAGGGGAGGEDSDGGFNPGGSGGGAGGYVKKLFAASDLADSVPYFVGDNGLGGSGGGSPDPGTDGELSIFGSLVAEGGGGGIAGANGGTGGSASNGDLNIKGGDGDMTPSIDGGQGGSGGNSFFGGAGASRSNTTAAAGSHGAGGGGGDSNNYTGGAGGEGLIIVTEHYI